MSSENKEMMRKVRGQIARRYVDISLVNITCIGGTVQLTGVLRPIRGHNNIDLREEMEHISKILRQQAGIRDVVWDVSLRA